MIEVDLQLATLQTATPNLDQLTLWCEKAIEDKRQDAEICIRIVDEQEARELNLHWRNKDYATNVLSFPADLPKELNLPLLGDLVLCAPVIINESIRYNKVLTTHWAHMIIHGTLHLLGFDHMEPRQADLMESMEIDIMQQLGYSNPYLDSANDKRPL